MSSNIEDNSHWISTSGESSADEDSDSDSIIPNSGTSSAGDRDQFNDNDDDDDDLAEGDWRQATPPNRTLSDDDRLSYNRSPVLIRTRQIQHTI